MSRVTNAFGEGERTQKVTLSNGDQVQPLTQNDRVLIWTTTPWTIPQNRAVAFNPEHRLWSL